VTLIDYSHLPMTFLRLRSAAALAALARYPGVRAIFTDEKKFPTLSKSLQLIGQPHVAAAGDLGSGNEQFTDSTSPNLRVLSQLPVSLTADAFLEHRCHSSFPTPLSCV
jgi:hypothetical protein